MLLLIAFTLGALYGWRKAKLRGGDRLDLLQYAAVHGILFTLLAVVGIIIFQNLAAR
jgi:hypothetical protein